MSERNDKGQFAPGHAGNPNGRRRNKTPEQRLQESILTEAPALVERALLVARTDNAVLAEVLRYLTECLATRNLEAAAHLAAMQHAAAAAAGIMH